MSPCESLPPCPEGADLDQDGMIGTSEVLLMLAAFGEVTTGPEDLNGDGMVNVSDVLLLLGSFGIIADQYCLFCVRVSCHWRLQTISFLCSPTNFVFICFLIFLFFLCVFQPETTASYGGFGAGRPTRTYDKASTFLVIALLTSHVSTPPNSSSGVSASF